VPLSLSVLSTQYVIVPLTILGPGAPNPTSDPVSFAFKAAGTDPSGTDWISGEWVPETLNGQYLMQCLVGPSGGTSLAIGSYVIWNKITDSPEVPVFQSGVLAITP
jgi:hypothetical protein